MLNFNDYAEHFKHLNNNFENSGNFDVVFKIYPKPYEDDIQELEDEIKAEQGMENFRKAESLRQFYFSSQRPHLSWQYVGHNDKQRITCGVVRIASIYQIYDPDEELGQPFRLIYQKYRLFDWLGENHQVYLKFAENVSEPELYYYSGDTDKSYRMSLNVSEYLHLAKETAGLFPWQEFFITDNNFKMEKEHARKFLDDLELLFPKADVSKFRF